jgi:hypothetical protein
MLRRRHATSAIICHIRIACWITKATDKHSEYHTSWFPTTTVVTRKRPNITFIRKLPVLLQHELVTEGIRT